MRVRRAIALVVLERFAGGDDGGEKVFLDLPVVVTPTAGPFEIWTHRIGAAGPLRAWQVTRGAGGTTSRLLPRGIVDPFGEGFRRFFHVRITNARGDTVHEADPHWCPGEGERERLGPTAEFEARFPGTCGGTPFSQGGVWGIERGWGGRVSATAADLADGRYLARISVNEPYRSLFGFGSASSVQVAFSVRTEEDPFPFPDDEVVVDMTADPRAPTRAAARDRSTWPDLAAVPAWDIAVDEAWCLAPTDAIDTTRRNAVWRPESTGLSTACGSLESQSVREVLPVGWGDTYGGYLPGMSFDITTVPNGVYAIAVLANPFGRLRETTSFNNVACRLVVLGGTRGDRTVRVLPWNGITERPAPPELFG